MRHVMNFTDVDDRTIARVAEGRRAAARVHRSVHRRRSARTPRPSASSRSRRCRAPPTTQNIAAMGETIARARGATATPTAATARSTSRSRRCPTTASWRGSITRGMQERRARRLRQVRQGRRPRLRAVEGDQAGRADLGSRHRSGPSRLAHRVLGDGAAPARRAADRHPRRRRRPDLPASRERDRAERRGDRAAVLALLGPRRAPDDRGRRQASEKMSKSLGNVYNLEDIVARGLPAVGAALSLPRRPLPQAAEVLVDGDGAGGGGAQAADRLPRAPRRAARARRQPGGRARGWTRRGVPSTSTSPTT